MCSACVTMRPRSSKSAVEQSRRSLMFAEKAERMSAAPISSAIARSDAPITCSSIGDHRVLRRTSVPCAVGLARPAGGDPGGRAVELEHLGPRAASRRPVDGEAGAGVPPPSARRRARSRARGRRSRSAPRGPRGTAPRDASERDRQLERLARVAEVRLALVRGAHGVGERRHVRPHGVAPLVGGDEAERGQDAAAAGTSTVVMPSSSASAQACSGPAPPKATSAKSRGSSPCSTETTRSAAPSPRSRRRSRPPGRCPPSACSAARRRARSLRQHARAGVRGGGSRRSPSPASRRVRSTPGPDRRLRSPGRRGAHHPRRARRSTLRPRRPCARRGSAAARAGRPRGARARAARRRRRSRRRPSTCRPCRTRARSRSRRALRSSRAPTTPAAGPESSANAAWAAASSSVARPPDERMTSGSGSPASAHAPASAPRYRGEHGPRYASTAVVEARSYSRNSGATSCEATTCADG